MKKSVSHFFFAGKHKDNSGKINYFATQGFAQHNLAM
jgi:hypothetical protein